MTAREKEILDILRENDMVSQQELVSKFCITRSSIAVHITNLMKIERFNTIKLDKHESEALSGIKISSVNDLELCSKYLLKQGVKKIFITLGKDGVFCSI